MSSQIYSRYVPPKKNEKKASPKQSAAISALKATPTTEHDAPSTYARYVPSKSKRRIEDSSEKSHNATTDTTATAPHHDYSFVSHSTVPDKIPTLKSTSDKVDEVDKRHKRLMEKREKSLKKAEKLAKKVAEKAAAESAGAGPESAEPMQNEPGELHDLVPLPQPEPIPETPVQSTIVSLPPWLSSPIRVSPTSTAPFSSVGINEEVEKILSAKGFKHAFAFQAAVLPLLLPGPSQSPGDILISASTGSGKTLAYVLPMIEDISTYMVTRLRGLIVMPTRELVLQAREVCEACVTAFSGMKRVKVGTAVGNETFKAEQDSLMDQELRYDPAGYKEQMRRLNAKWESSDIESDSENEFLCDDEPVSPLPDHVICPRSKVDILISTPGRLVEHLKSTPGFSLEYIKWFVVDEADKLLNQSFQQWLEITMGRLGPRHKSFRNNRVRKIIASATMTRDIGQLHALKLFRPQLVVLEGSHNVSDTREAASHALPGLLVESAVKAEDEGLKPLYLLELIRREKMYCSVSSGNDSSSPEGESSDSDDTSSDDDFPENPSPEIGSLEPSEAFLPQSNPRGVLVFTKSNETAVRLGRLLALLEPSFANVVGTLTSTISTSSRRKAIKSFNAGRLSILVASDLVSRGLDLSNLAHVINYDVPSSVTNYVHRVGRTARAGKKGWAWTIFTPAEGRWFWNEIARSKDITRKAGTKLSRVTIDMETFGGEMRKSYEAALDQLGREAKSTSSKKAQSS